MSRITPHDLANRGVLHFIVNLRRERGRAATSTSSVYQRTSRLWSRLPGHSGRKCTAPQSWVNQRLVIWMIGIVVQATDTIRSGHIWRSKHENCVGKVQHQPCKWYSSKWHYVVWYFPRGTPFCDFHQCVALKQSYAGMVVVSGSAATRPATRLYSHRWWPVHF